MKSNEDTTNQKYEDAVKAASGGQGGSNLLEDLQRNLDDERRHRAWIETRLAKSRRRISAAKRRPVRMPPARSVRPP